MILSVGNQSSGINDPKAHAKVRLLHRLIISYQDFQQASWIASYIIDHQLQDKYEELEQGEDQHDLMLLWRALNAAMIVAYARPFSKHDPTTTASLGTLPGRFLKALSTEQMDVHRTAIRDRNQVIAHSDSEAWDLKVAFVSSRENALLGLQHNDTQAPLIKGYVEILGQNCEILQERILDERAALEENLRNVIPTLNVDSGSSLGGG